MILFSKVRVPVPSAACGSVEMYVSRASRVIIRGNEVGSDWTSLHASPKKVLEWFATADFAANGRREALARFAPCGQRLASLDQLKREVRPPLAVPRFWQLGGSDYGFDAAHHLPYWLAMNDASFVPLLVPTHQMAHFSQALVG